MNTCHLVSRQTSCMPCDANAWPSIWCDTQDFQTAMRGNMLLALKRHCQDQLRANGALVVPDQDLTKLLIGALEAIAHLQTFDTIEGKWLQSPEELAKVALSVRTLMVGLGTTESTCKARDYDTCGQAV